MDEQNVAHRMADDPQLKGITYRYPQQHRSTSRILALVKEARPTGPPRARVHLCDMSGSGRSTETESACVVV